MGDALKIPAMDTLKRWKTQGKIDLIEAAPPRTVAYGWPGSPPKPAPFQRGGPRQRMRVKKDPPGGVNFKGVASVIFPNRDSQKLNMGEINDVAHLVKHHASKHEFFVTVNLGGLIQNGRRESLKSCFGIIAVTPDEAVQMLGSLEGWK